MDTASKLRATHDHVYLGRGHTANQRRTWMVVGVTAVMMVAEISCGYLFGSMSLLADGWHMGTHVGALSIAAFAYGYATKHAHDPRFSFGTGKLGDLAGFASAIVLGSISLWIGFESCARLAAPVPIAFDSAIGVAVLGLAVNLLSAWVLGSDAAHESQAHGPHDSAEHGARALVQRDNNLRAAYVHVLADALTSIFAIIGLCAGRFAGWNWMDALVGVLGAVLIARWSWSLIRDSALVLLDVVPSRELVELIRARVEVEGDRVDDLHLWRVGPGHAAAIVSIVAERPQSLEVYRARLAGIESLSHVTIEVSPSSAVRA